MELDEKLAEVGAYSFNRDDVPIYVGEHRLELLRNDAYFHEDGRIKICIELYCTECGERHVTRGTPVVSGELASEHICAIKLYALAKFYEM